MWNPQTSDFSSWLKSEFKHRMKVENDQGDEVLPMVLADLEERARVGEMKHKNRYRVWTRTKPLQEAYEEALDLCMYLRAAIEQADTQAAENDWRLLPPESEDESDKPINLVWRLRTGPAAERDRLLVECEAWRAGKLTLDNIWENPNDDPEECYILDIYNPVDGVGRTAVFMAIEDAVDALMAEREMTDGKR